MEGIFSYIPFIGGGGGGIGGGTNWGYIFIWTFIILMICGGGFTTFFLIFWQRLTTKTIEIDGETHRIRIFRGRIKKAKDGTEHYYARKLKKFLQRPQQKDFYLQGRRDVLFFLKDNNGLHHTLRVPAWEELKKYYQVTQGLNIEDTEDGKKIKDIFFLPNPYEDLDWLANTCTEADKEFKDTHWWQHPNAMIIGTAMICMIMFIMTIVLSGKVI